MHGPAEHTFEKVQHDLEMHIVHSLVDGPDKESLKEKYAVVGILFKIDKITHPVLRNMNIDTLAPVKDLKLSELFNKYAGKEPAFIHYKGGLTTPPCTAVVNWLIYKEILPITEKDAFRFQKYWYSNCGCGNFRECCPLCSRRIVKNF